MTEAKADSDVATATVGGFWKRDLGRSVGVAFAVSLGVLVFNFFLYFVFAAADRSGSATSSNLESQDRFWRLSILLLALVELAVILRSNWPRGDGPKRLRLLLLLLLFPVYSLVPLGLMLILTSRATG